ncbi:MAG: hypothetical protein IT464_02885 [Planctomycetes bacterium]|nr:hypothetical protein [Planctomycetota bacterium]
MIRILPAVLAGLFVFSAIAQAQDTKPRIDALFKFNDTDKDGKLQWAEVWQRTLDYRKARQAPIVVKPGGDNGEDLDAMFADLLLPMHCLLADANKDLTVTRAELTSYIRKVDANKAPEPAEWHWRQLMAAEVELYWGKLINYIDEDEDERVSSEELLGLTGNALPDGEFEVCDKDSNGGLDKAEFVTLKARECLRGELVEYDLPDAVFRASGGTEAEVEGTEPEEGEEDDTASRKDPDKETRSGWKEADATIKVGAKWIARVRYAHSIEGKQVTEWRWCFFRYEITAKSEYGWDIAGTECDDHGKVLEGAKVDAYRFNAQPRHRICHFEHEDMRRYAPKARTLKDLTIGTAVFKSYTTTEPYSWYYKRSNNNTVEAEFTMKGKMAWTNAFIDNTALPLRAEMDKELYYEFLRWMD